MTQSPYMCTNRPRVLCITIRERYMTDELLRISGISAGTEDKPILHDINLTIGFGETHVLMGPNGAGKSTLGRVVMGDPTQAPFCLTTKTSRTFLPISARLQAYSFHISHRSRFPVCLSILFCVPLRKCVRSSKQPRAISVSALEKFPTGLSLTRAS